MKEEQPQIAAESMQDKVLPEDDQVGEMKQVEIEINEDEMRNESLSMSSSSEEEGDQQIIEQEV